MGFETTRSKVSAIGQWPVGLLSGLLILILLLGLPTPALAANAQASVVRVVAAAGAAGGTLAVVRAGGAGLHKTPGGEAAQALVMGAALTAIGRNADSSWIFVSTKGGENGWIPAERLVVFGLKYLPVLSDWQEPAQPAGFDTTSSVLAGLPTSSATPAGQIATVTTTEQRLNVRSGPGATYQVIASLGPGETASALARNANGQWLQLQLAGGQSGWASADFLRLNGDLADLPKAEQAGEAAPAAAAAVTASAAPGLTGRLVFQERSGEMIHVYDLATGELRPLTRGADPAISPDGQRVTFWRGGGENSLYLIDIDGSNERRILTRGEMIRSPTWSPDGQLIAFSRITGQDRCRDAGYGICLPDVPPYNMLFPLKLTDIWGLSRVDSTGGSFRDLPAQPGAKMLSWSDAGIVYSGGPAIELTQDSDDDENRALLSDFKYQDPAWQPGGWRIVFQSKEKDHWEIFSASGDGSNPVALTRPATTLMDELPHNVAPTWSPDGQHIVFLSNRSGQWALWVMNADGSNQRQLPVDVPIEYAYQAEQVVSWGR